MNKTQLVDAIALEAGLTKVDARKATDVFLKTIGEQLKQGEKVAIVGFGTFSVLERPARMGRNPYTGTKMEIGKKKIVKFKAGSELNNDVQ
jgi:DNA-binding protein HU-beta